MANKYDFCKDRTANESLKWYQQGGFANLNSFLNQKKLTANDRISNQLRNINILKQVTKDALNLSSIMQTSRNDVTVFRGDNNSHFNMDELQTSTNIAINGFWSSSASEGVAKSFTSNTLKAGTIGIVFEIKIPKGGKLLSIQNPEFSFEEETLLPPAKYDILNISKTGNGTYHVTIEQKEILEISSVIDSSLDNISNQLSILDLLKKKQLANIKQQCHKYIDYEKTNPTINILPHVQVSTLQSPINVEISNPNNNVYTNENQIENEQKPKTFEDEMEL